METGNFQAEFAKLRNYRRRGLFAKLVVVHGKVQSGKFAFADDIGYLGNDNFSECFVDGFRFVNFVSAGQFGHQFLRIDDTVAVDAVAAQSDDAEIRVPEHDRVCGAPFLVDKLFGVYKVNVAFKRRFKRVFPAVNGSQERKVGRFKFISARSEHVGNFAFVHENASLRFSDGELGTLHNFISVRNVETLHDDIGAVVLPFDDFEHLSFNETHDISSIRLFFIIIMIIS